MEEFTFFYGGPASQWAPTSFTIEGVIYNTAEQYMMAEKARLFGDQDALGIIMNSKNPKVQKATGRVIRGFSEASWMIHRELIVYRANLAKFTQDESAWQWLHATKGTTLVEASPWDNIWGIGLSADDARAQSRDTWQGGNLLGEILTKVREDIMVLQAAAAQ